jgi:hypothetical protein
MKAFKQRRAAAYTLMILGATSVMLAFGNSIGMPSAQVVAIGSERYHRLVARQAIRGGIGWAARLISKTQASGAATPKAWAAVVNTHEFQLRDGVALRVEIKRKGAGFVVTATGTPADRAKVSRESCRATVKLTAKGAVLESLHRVTFEAATK